ncbi:MAG TPA: hypothetical protein VGV15_20360 [Terriglobales bacterium]|nr:hypothetical protein [Terriglobales bacterium]
MNDSLGQSQLYGYHLLLVRVYVEHHHKLVIHRSRLRILPLVSPEPRLGANDEQYWKAARN